MVFLRRKLPDANTYTFAIGFPSSHDFSFSAIVRRVFHVVPEFRITVRRRGNGKVEYLLGAGKDINDNLPSIFTSTEFRCTVERGTPARPREFRTFAGLKRPPSDLSIIGTAIHSALLSTREGEEFAVKFDFRKVRKRRKYRDMERIGLSLGVMFNGIPDRLKELLPEVRDRKSWIFLKPLARIPLVADIQAIDEVLPSPPSGLIEAEFEPTRGRHYFAPQDNQKATDGLCFDGDRNRPFSLSDSALNENTIIFGMTGSGKTTLLARLLASRIEDGNSILVIDPHGDLATKVVGMIGDTAGSDKVLYIDPLKSPVGLNPLTLAAGANDNPAGPSIISDAIGYAIRRTFGEEYWGPRVNFLMTGLIRSLSEAAGWNFVDAMEILDNPASLRTFSQQVRNEVSRNFLLTEVPKAAGDWWMSLKDKIGMVVLDDVARRILCKRENNLDLDAVISENTSVIMNLDMTRIGNTSALLIGSIMIAMIWLRASSLRRKMTIVIDEFQYYPLKLIQDIASQGRKYGLNLIIASQSPSHLSKADLGSLATNFRNTFMLRLGREDAKLASSFSNGIDADELCSIGPLNAIFGCPDGTGIVSIDPVPPDAQNVSLAIENTKKRYPFVDDSFPSLLAMNDEHMFNILQIARTAELQGKRSIAALESGGLLDFYGYTPDSFRYYLKIARSTGLVDSRSLKVSEQGVTELFRLQGGAIAGGEKHRTMLQEVKDIFDIMGFLTNMPYQRESTSNPDLIIKSSTKEDGRLFFVEMEIGSRFDSEGRKSKAESARQNGATPVFVYEDTNAAELAYINTPGVCVILVYDGGELSRYTERGLVPIKSMTDMMKRS